MNSSELYAAYVTKMQQIADIKYASAVLQWDQETYLPPKGNQFRGRQIATLNEQAHLLFANEKTGALLTELMSREDLTIKQKQNVTLSFYDYNRAKKFSGDFVRRMSEATSKTFHAWLQARKENSFTFFENPLEGLIDLKKQEADALGYTDHPYSALMNDYDRGLNVSIADKVFADLKPQLKKLLAAIESKQQVDDSFLRNFYDKDKQWQFGIEILKIMRFDFEAGRQDISEHPFTINFNNKDVRITTRIDENDFTNMTWSCIHEGGHALYEQGLPGEEYGLPLGEYCSLSMHESQSRLWENNIGRSLRFWQNNFSLLQTFFPNQLDTISVEQFYRAINKVSPSLIRTEADEVTYHFHVMIRYEIEKLLIEGTVKTADIPGYWSSHYKEYLDITVPDDKSGCLQDVHWSHGSFGYFATYSLGSLYAAQLHQNFIKSNKSTDNNINKSDTTLLLNWLKENIYQYGRFYTSEELCKKVTGEALNSTHFIRYATEKYSKIYNF